MLFYIIFSRKYLYMDAKAFWGNVNPLIKSRKTTQRVLAQEIGVSFGTFQGWIARDTLPDAIETYRIAQALGTTVEFLVSGKEPEASSTYLDALKSIKGIVDKAIP